MQMQMETWTFDATPLSGSILVPREIDE
jgi:hypothetical protein